MFDLSTAYVLNCDVYDVFGVWRSRQVSGVFQYQLSDSLLDRHKYFVHLVMCRSNCRACLTYAVQNLERSVMSCL